MSSCCIVVVAGGTASGKTTIVSQAVSALSAVHIAHDRYYIDAEDPSCHDFDHPDSLETSLLVEQLGALKRGEAVQLPRYGFPNHRRQAQTDTVGPAAVVIVEGILVLQSEAVRALADLCVYVQAPETVRLQRRLQRDVVERGRSEASVMDRYTQMVKPSHDAFVEPSSIHAGLTLDGTASVEASVAQLMGAIRGAELGQT
jgi:uridine kinase